MPAPRNRDQQERAGVLAGRKAIVTGATSGIGYDVALMLALEVGVGLMRVIRTSI
jgi:NAD(P)-dependent dehydrogenase (short-subunit alcohol dehydrogenase family)